MEEGDCVCVRVPLFPQHLISNVIYILHMYLLFVSTW